MSARAFMILLLLAVAGCASEVPRREPPPAPVGEQSGAPNPASLPTFTYRPGS